MSRESERLRLVTNTLLSVGVAGRDGIPVPVQLRREEIVSVLDELDAALARLARLEAALVDAVEALEKISIIHKDGDSNHVCGLDCPVLIYSTALCTLRAALRREGNK